MKKPFRWFFYSPSVAALLWLGVTAPVHGGEQRGCAIRPPFESPDRPGFNSANGDIGKKGGFFPYYSTLVPISARWRYKELIPYYPGYCRKGTHGASRDADEVEHATVADHESANHSSDGATDQETTSPTTCRAHAGLKPRDSEHDASDTKSEVEKSAPTRTENNGKATELLEASSFDYGVFTSAPGTDDRLYWRMGGNGVVPYGASQAPRSRPDFIDMIEARGKTSDVQSCLGAGDAPGHPAAMK